MNLKKILTLIVLFLSACHSAPKEEIVPAIVPSSQKAPQIKYIRPSNIIGEIEPIYMLPMKSAFLARVDTGATTSSIDVQNLKRFERDGKRWVSFFVVNAASGEKHFFEKPVIKRVKIKRIEEEEHRVKVMMDVKFGGQKMKTEFTLAERESFSYQGLIGRNILTGRYIVDTSLTNTLK
ncbi:MAG: ATP-dependent zinc protease [Alphaproteobacteria bacterium]|nr:ATP-dependent zinc protease [Alphaproteobacteria bacterium]